MNLKLQKCIFKVHNCKEWYERRFNKIIREIPIKIIDFLKQNVRITKYFWFNQIRTIL